MFNKKLISILCILMLVLFTGCTNKNEEVINNDVEENTTDDVVIDDNVEKKTLVVVFSATGTTKEVAEMIVDITGADLYEITAVEPYTDEDLSYNNKESRATIEQNDPAVRPEISGDTLDLSAYDKVFIGYPIWFGQAPRIMDSFVESYDFEGITIIPFCTSGSSDIGNSDDILKENAGSGNWLEGRRFPGGIAQSDVKDWIDSLD